MVEEGGVEEEDCMERGRGGVLREGFGYRCNSEAGAGRGEGGNLELGCLVLLGLDIEFLFEVDEDGLEDVGFDDAAEYLGS